MEQCPEYDDFCSLIKEGLEKFYTSFENDENGKKAIEKFLYTVDFGIENVATDEVVQSLLNKNFFPNFMQGKLFRQIYKEWKRLTKASLSKSTSSRISLTVGTESPEIKKSHLNLEVLSDRKKQIELLNNNLSAVNPDIEVPFIAVKLYTSTPYETKEFLDGMLQMVDGLIQSMPIPIIPEISTVAGNDHIIVQATAKKSLELNFFNSIIGHLATKLPEYDLEMRVNLQTGTNWRHLIQNHTDNTVFDVLNGFKVSVEMKNNLAGFFDTFTQMFVKKDNKKDSSISRLISFVLGSCQLSADLSLNLGANELSLMANLPPVNIFDKEGLLSAAPISSAKGFMEDEMGQMILPNLTNLEGKAELFVSTPFVTIHADVDQSGILELVVSTINLFTS